jgi:DNA polymerase III subunit beta
LVRYRRTDVSSSIEAAVIVPKKTLGLLKNALPSDNSPLSMYFNKTNAYFVFSNIKLSCRLIDERFPDYENVIPLNNTNSLTVSRTEFIGSLKRIAIYANKSTNLVKFKFVGEDTLAVSAEDLDFSNEASEQLGCTYEGKEMEIGFQARMFSEMLANLHSGEIALKMSEPNRAALLLPTENYEKEDVLMLVMPVNLVSYY